MRFIDEVKITIFSGSGGKGCTSFRREKYIPFGGPDGGDGGTGGSIIFEADENINTLVHFRGQRVYRAQNGEQGLGSQCNGKSGEDLILKVPVGTLLRDEHSGDILYDLSEHGMQITVLKGGRGGLGNMNFKSSTNQAPRYSQPGDEGHSLQLTLELKLLADIALIGYPNAGKSTLISVISAAKPKIADYPFTTLEPNLGVVRYDDTRSFVVADIPGLIEDASKGKGLGIRFLKHIERCKSLVHLIDCSMYLSPDEAMEAYAHVRIELEHFNPDLLGRREIICLTKIDAMDEDTVNLFVSYLEENLGKKVLPISSVAGRNIDKLVHIMGKSIDVDKKLASKE